MVGVTRRIFTRESRSRMLSQLERLIILRGVGIFAATPEHALGEVAGVLVEEEYPAGAIVVQKGDLGTSMHLIVSGRVRVHDGEHILNFLGPRDVFGEMGVLDPGPRVATVTATEPIVLLRLDSDLLYDLLDRRPEIGRGLIRGLIGHLRARVQDIAAARRQLDLL